MLNELVAFEGPLAVREGAKGCIRIRGRCSCRCELAHSNDIVREYLDAGLNKTVFYNFLVLVKLEFQRRFSMMRLTNPRDA